MAVKKICLLLLTWISCTGIHADMSSNQAAQNFIKHMSKNHQYDKKDLTKLLKNVERNQSVLKLIKKPAEKLSWDRYRKLLVTDQHVKQGKSFLKNNAKALQAAEDKFGVPKEIITAIIGVETFYGKRQGSHQVLSALATLAFHYPPRSKFFTEELEHFLLLAREQAFDPTKLTGSYAGAMGVAQFMPSSFRNYAIDFANSGKIDIWDNMTNAIGSVANYFKVHGWKKGGPITIPANINNKSNVKPASMYNPKPNHKLVDLQQKGIKPRVLNYAKGNELTALLRLKKTNTDEHWLGFNNFYVITRYNHSVNYAMAVYQLSQKLT